MERCCRSLPGRSASVSWWKWKASSRLRILARAHWVAVERWNTLPAAELKELLRHARELVCEKLPPRTKALLAMAPSEKKKLIAARKKLLASKKR